jgi:tetratricopeptide (TPR) repeat protein
MPTREELYDEADRLKEQGKMDEAIAKLHEAVAIDPNFALAYAALSKYHSNIGQHDKAIAYGIKLTQLEPNDPFSFTALSVIYVRAGRIMEAEDAKARAHGLSGHRH